MIKTESLVDTLVTPDEIFLNILTKKKGTKEELNELESKMIVALNILGIDSKNQLTINDFGSHYYSSFLFSKNIKQRRNYELMVYTAKEAIAVIEALNKMDIGNIGLNRTVYSKMDNLMLELRSKAVSKAKKQAESLVHPLNQKVGRALMIIDFNENDIVNLRPSLAGTMYKKGYSKHKEEIYSTILELKKIHVIKKIVVHFKLE